MANIPYMSFINLESNIILRNQGLHLNDLETIT